MATKAQQQVGLQTTVMVDVLFILLIFFIVVSRVKDSNLPVDLPSVDRKKQTAPAVRGNTGLTISIDRKGGLHLNGEAASGVKGLRQLLSAHKSKATGLPVALRADKQAPSGVTVQVVHLLSEMGFTKVQFDVLQAQSGGNDR